MIPLPVAGAIDLLGQSGISAFDRTSANVDGFAQTVDGPHYTFSGSIQPASDKEMKRLGQGYESDGTLVIRTRGTLSYIDTSSPGNVGSSNNTQTFVNHFNEMWRVEKLANWGPTGAYRKYIAIKHIER